MNRSVNKKLIVLFCVLLFTLFTAAVSSAAIGNAWLEQNLRFYPNLVRDGVTQPIVSMDAASWIYEEVWVEAPLDSDGDGKRDLLRAGIRRPRITVSANDRVPGLVCPVLIEASPYHDSSTGNYSSPYNFGVDGEYPGADTPATLDRQYSDLEYQGHTYKDIVAANFKPDWLPAERTSAGFSRDGTPVPAPGIGGSAGWMNYFMARGYAFIRFNIIGSGKAEGILPVGGYDENISAASVTDWLNGRVKAYTDPYNNIEVKAYWATGDTAMGGQSYNGAIPTEAAMTGVEGLRTIVPSAPPVSWYDYYRANGLTYAAGGFQGEDIPELMSYCWGRGYNTTPSVVYPTQQVWDNYYARIVSYTVECDRTTGSYSAFWDERNHTRYAGDLKSSILLFHGVNDLNVDTKHGAMLWYAAKEHGVPMKAIFHLEKHATPWQRADLGFLPKIHKWIDYHLYGIQNGAMEDIPNVTIQNNNTLAYDTYDDWPISTKYQRLYPKGDRVGTLSINSQKAPANLDFADDKIFALTRPAAGNQMATAQYTRWKHHIIGGTETPMEVSFDIGKITANGDRLIFLADIIEDTRIDGTVKMTAKVAADKNVGVISAMLVDFGDDKYVHRTFASAGTIISNTAAGTFEMYPADPNGAWNALNQNLTRNRKPDVFDPWNILARGSVNLQKPNYNGKIWLDAADTNYIPEYYYQTTAIEPGKFYPYTWELNTISYEIQKGHKLGIILFGTDPEYTQRPLSPTNLTVEIGPDTYLSLPVVDFATNEVLDPVGPQPITPEAAFGGSANIPAGTSVAADVLVWNTEFTDEGVVLSETTLDGWTIYDFSPKSGDGWTASLVDGRITVKFSKAVANQDIQIYLSKTVTGLSTLANEESILKVRFSGKASVIVPPITEGGSGGCNAAYSALALLALLPFTGRKRS